MSSLLPAADYRCPSKLVVVNPDEKKLSLEDGKAALRLLA